MTAIDQRNGSRVSKENKGHIGSEGSSGCVLRAKASCHLSSSLGLSASNTILSTNRPDFLKFIGRLERVGIELSIGQLRLDAHFDEVCTLLLLLLK
mmetsp:Transcript_14051/g.42862  ORF Transcript_14051/g.42862 Transcript_14051/m.42862 type:complete len:96 (+) Transcript_14051:535-822(+)